MDSNRTTMSATRRHLRRLLPLVLGVPILLGVTANRLFEAETADDGGSGMVGELRTVNLHGVPITGCGEVCPEYNIDTNFSTRLGTVSQFAALVPGRTSAEGELFLNGFGGTLVDVEGNLVADLRSVDPGSRPFSKGYFPAPSPTSTTTGTTRSSTVSTVTTSSRATKVYATGNDVASRCSRPCPTTPASMRQ